MELGIEAFIEGEAMVRAQRKPEQWRQWSTSSNKAGHVRGKRNGGQEGEMFWWVVWVEYWG